MKRGLQAVVAAYGLLAVVTGLMAVVGGPAGMLDGQATTNTVDSEVRFMAVCWIAFGVALWWLVPRVATATAAFRAMLVVMFAGGVARAVSWLATGRPVPVIAIGTVVSLVLPVLLAIWQARVAAATAPPDRGQNSSAGSNESRMIRIKV